MFRADRSTSPAPTLAFSLILALASIPLSPAAPLRAGTAVSPAGHWEGTIDVPEKPVGIEVDLVSGAGGALAGTFSNPARHLQGIPLANVAARDASVSFEIKAKPGGAFEATISGDGKSMSGTFSMPASAASPAVDLPFHLARTGEARVEPAPTSPAIGRELEGEWRGTIDVNGTKKTVGLRLANRPDGKATGTLVSEGLEIPLTIVQKGSAVTLEVKAVGGSWTGTLVPGGKDLSGTWTQGAFTGSLTFERAAP